jgi:hypothetical protein
MFLEQLNATLVLELQLAQEDTIVILPHHTPHALALAQLVAAVAHMAEVPIKLVKHALELPTTQLTTTLYV